jgi:hypothetical protein
MSTYEQQPPKNPLLAYLVIIILLALVVMWGSGCGVRNKNIQTYTQKVDSTFTQIKKETAQVTKDSAKTSNNSEIKEYSSSFNIVFSDTIKSDDPVVIEYDTIGRLVIHSGGRIIKSISTTKKIKEVKQTADSDHVVNTSNLVKSDSTNIDLSKSVKSVSSKMFVFAIPWYAYVIGVVAIGLTWFF